MRLFVVCDNDDTACGLRLAGIEGVVVADGSQAEAAVANAARDRNIGIILINRKLAASCCDFILDFRKKHSLPLIVEVPDADGTKGDDSIARYVREAVGIK